jgi:hypothetical protein
MRLLRVVFALCLASASAIALAAEPPAHLQVKIGDARAVIETGKLAEISVDGKRVKVLIEELPTRHFNDAGIRFEYPRHFSWEEEDGLWTLDGNSTSVIVARGDDADPVTPEAMLDSIVEELRLKSSTERSSVVLDTRRGSVEGLATTVRIATSNIRYEAYVLEQGKAQIGLILQDTLDDARKPSAEFIDMRKRLVESLEF